MVFRPPYRHLRRLHQLVVKTALTRPQCQSEPLPVIIYFPLFVSTIFQIWGLTIKLWQVRENTTQQPRAGTPAGRLYKSRLAWEKWESISELFPEEWHIELCGHVTWQSQKGWASQGGPGRLEKEKRELLPWLWRHTPHTRSKPE